MAPIGDELSFAYGNSLPSHVRQPGKIPVFGSNGQVGWHSEVGIIGPGIIVGRKGSVGEVKFSTSDYWPIDTTYYVVNPKAHNWRYLFYLLKHADLTGLNSHSAVPGLNREDAYAIQAWFPDAETQEKIANALDNMTSCLALEKHAIISAQRIKQATMHELFTRGLRGEARKETEIGLMPKSWNLVRLEEVFETQLGKMLSRKAHGGDSPMRYMRNKNVQWGRLDVSDLLSMDFSESEKEKFRLKTGDLLVCEGGIIGRAAIWHGELDECYYQKALHRIRPKNKTASNEFLCYWLSYAFEHQNLYNIGGASSTIAHLPQGLLEGLQIPLVPKAEQAEIVETLTAVDRKISLHTEKKSVLDELFRSLLNKLMTGEISVEDLDLSALTPEEPQPKTEAEVQS